MSRRNLPIALAALLLAPVGCSREEQVWKTRNLADSILGIQIEVLEINEADDADPDDDDQIWSFRASVRIGGGEPHEILIDEDNNPVMATEFDADKVTDVTSGNVRTFESDQDLEQFRIADGDQGLGLYLNPDGTWVVGDAPGGSAAAAAAIAVRSPLVQGASIHGLAAIEALLRYRADGADSRTVCAYGGDGSQCAGSSIPPPEPERCWDPLQNSVYECSSGGIRVCYMSRPRESHVYLPCPGGGDYACWDAAKQLAYYCPKHDGPPACFVVDSLYANPPNRKGHYEACPPGQTSTTYTHLGLSSVGGSLGIEGVGESLEVNEHEDSIVGFLVEVIKLRLAQ